MKMKNPLKKLWKKKLSERNDEGESLFDIIRNIVKEEFKIHESNMKELINYNVNKTTERLDKLSAVIVDLTAILEFTQKNWRGTISGRKRNKKFKNRGQSHRRWTVKCRWNTRKINWIRGQISKKQPSNRWFKGRT